MEQVLQKNLTRWRAHGEVVTRSPPTTSAGKDLEFDPRLAQPFLPCFSLLDKGNLFAPIPHESTFVVRTGTPAAQTASDSCRFRGESGEFLEFRRVQAPTRGQLSLIRTSERGCKVYRTPQLCEERLISTVRGSEQFRQRKPF